ncbi:MAG TPA: zinc-dependent metalloprotease [Propionicimonas sp.]|nr:zinc-dependent metalloprotease [Propionicimonas sp.]
MSDPNFPGGQPDPGDADDALKRLLAQLGLTPDAAGELNPEQVMQQLQSMMTAFNTQLAGFGASDATSGMNWGFTRDLVLRATREAGPDTEPPAAQQARIRDAVALADLWLGEDMDFAPLSAPALAWRREDWIEHTFGTWQQLIQPVISQLSIALRSLISEGQPGATEPMLRIAVASMFAAQISETLASLATTVLSATDIGLPISDEARVCVVPANIETFSDGLGVDSDDLLLYLGVREAARQRLFHAVGWLGPQLLALIEHYAREITIDPEALEQAIESQLNSVMSMEDLEKAGNAVAKSLFAPQRTAVQQEILERLETLLALVEGWVDHVTAEVTRSRMPSAIGLAEMLRRRRASGGPAETALRTLVGLELRPRRTRDAENLWAALRSARGSEGRDALWAHPDLLPDAAALDDPLGFASGDDTDQAPDALDTELAKLLEEEGRGDDRA